MIRLSPASLALALLVLGLPAQSQTEAETVDFAAASSMQGYKAGVSAWLQFRGDLVNTGVSHSVRPDYPNLKQAWKYFANSPLTSTPAFAAGRVIAAGEDGFVHAIDGASGRSIWRVRCGGPRQGEGIVISSPMILDGRIYVGTKIGTLHALDLATGRELWTYRCKEVEPDGSVGKIYASPKGDARGIVFSSTAGYVYCLDPVTGDLRWTHRLFRETGASAAILGDKVYVAGKDRELREIDYATGTLKRSVQLPGTTHATPAIGLGFAYLITGTRETVAVDLLEGKVAWTGEATGDDKLCAAVAHGTVYFPLGQFVYAMEGVSGKRRWSAQAEHKTTPIVINGDDVIFADRSGWLRIHDAKSGKEVRSVQVGEGMVAGPILVDGTIYVATDVNEGVHVFAFR